MLLASQTLAIQASALKVGDIHGHADWLGVGVGSYGHTHDT